MRLLNVLFVIMAVASFSGCSSSGTPFQQLVSPQQGNSVVYLLRGNSFVSSLNCPDVKVNDTYVGCLKQNGFIKIEMEAGANKICFCRSALEVGDDTVLNLNLSAGEVRFFEWKPEIGDMVFIGSNVHATGGKMESIIEHSNDTALPLLKDFKDSI